MIRAVLVDDEPPARVRMRQLPEAASDVAVVGEAGNADEARAVIRNTRPDLLFLDVEMPEVRGTALAASLPEPRPFIVFATAFDNYGLDAIAVDATDYLLKPVSKAKLAATLDRVRAKLSKLTVERDVVAAAKVQAHMWAAALPKIAGFDCAAASLPARGVGGDFYDLFPIQGSRWGFLLGDASGKGVAAGLVASAVQARVHTAARLAHLTPQALMAAVNRDVYATTDGARYATAIYGELDTITSALQLVVAGHLPAIIIGDSIRQWCTTGGALGLVDRETFEARDLVLPRGSMLVAYTDGVTDALNAAGEEYQEDLLLNLLDVHRDRRAADICALVLDAVRLHRGLQQDQDDVTVMVIKHEGRS